MRKAYRIRRAEREWDKVKEQLKREHPYWLSYIDYR